MNKIIIAMLLAVFALAVAAFVPPSVDAKAEAPDQAQSAKDAAFQLIRAKHAATAAENRVHARTYMQIDRIGEMAARSGDAALRAQAERVIDLEKARYAAEIARIEAMERAPVHQDGVVLPLQPTAEERSAFAADASAAIDAHGAAGVLAQLEAQLTR